MQPVQQPGLSIWLQAASEWAVFYVPANTV